MFYCLVLKISVYPAERRGNNNYKPHHVYNNIDFTDVEDVKFVINFDYPSNSEDYVHRIGRTGRSQRTGTAYTFFTPANANKAADLVSVLKEAKQVINPKLQEMADSRNWNSNSGSGRGKCAKIMSGRSIPIASML
jgi:ERCC4-related helicase